jgi:hypothetical protein
LPGNEEEEAPTSTTSSHVNYAPALAAAMNPGSPSRHPSEAEEEDSPLQQSTQAPNPQMADSYPEDIMSEAEKEMAGQTAEEAAEKELDGGAEEEEQDDRAEEEEQIPKNLHGYWVKCHVKDIHVQDLENEGTVAPQAESHWRTDFKGLVPAPNSTEIVMLKSHVERGLSMPPSPFFTNLLKFYGLQLHHIAPNSLVSVAGYAALCEGFLGIHPRVDLFQLFFSVRANYEDDGFLRTYGTIYFLPRRSKEYPFITPLYSTIGWRGSWFYMADKPAPSQARDLLPFENIAAQPLDSWNPVNDKTATPYVKLLARRIAKLSKDGLKGIDTINCRISRQIQPLQHRDSLMHEYTGAKDGMRYSDKEVDPNVVEMRIRSLMKSPRKKPLKFGMTMFENGSCPLVSFFFAIILMIPLNFHES